MKELKESLISKQNVSKFLNSLTKSSISDGDVIHTLNGLLLIYISRETADKNFPNMFRSIKEKVNNGIFFSPDRRNDYEFGYSYIVDSKYNEKLERKDHPANNVQNIYRHAIDLTKSWREVYDDYMKFKKIVG